MTAPDLFAPTLARLHAEASLHFGTPDVELTPVRYEERPFSHVIRVRVDAAATEQPQYVFVKVFKPKADLTREQLEARVMQEFTTTATVHDAMRGDDRLGAIRPLACYPEQLAICTYEAAGRTLLAYLHAHAAWYPGAPAMRELTGTLETIGRWVRTFQRLEPADTRVSLPAIRDYIDLRLARLTRERRAGFGEHERARVLSHVDALIHQVPDGDLREVPIHADLAPGNILVSGARIVVLDLAMMRRGSRVHDLARLSMQLELFAAKPQFRRPVIASLQAALLRGFDPALTAADPLFRLLSTLHRINNVSTVVFRRERFPASLYNAHIGRIHRRWIDRETASAAVGR